MYKVLRTFIDKYTKERVRRGLAIKLDAKRVKEIEAYEKKHDIKVIEKIKSTKPAKKKED